MSAVWRAIGRWLFPVWCIGCGAPERALCAQCSASLEPAELRSGGMPVHAAGDYDGVLRAAILALKRGERAYLDPLAELLAPLVAPDTALIPIRTSRRRAAERGFDQAVELARRVAAMRSGWVDDVLTKHGAAQRGRTRDERFEASGRFRLRPGADVPTSALLLDDVFTTGATFRDAAATLTSAGCWVRGGIVVARTLPQPETPRAARRLVEA